MKVTPLRAWAAGLAGSLVLRAVGATWRVRILHDDVRAGLAARGVPMLFAFFHSRMLIPAYTHRGTGTALLISRHGDGELIARVAGRLGFRTVRGSTTRGGAAALHQLAGLPPHVPVAITPDGPRGPAEQVQPGVVWLASRTGRTVVPGGLAARSAWRLRSWDRFQVPRPFTTVAVAVGRPLAVPPGLPRAEIPPLAEEIRRRILEAEVEAGAAVGLAPEPAAGEAAGHPRAGDEDRAHAR